MNHADRGGSGKPRVWVSFHMDLRNSFHMGFSSRENILLLGIPEAHEGSLSSFTSLVLCQDLSILFFVEGRLFFPTSSGLPSF